LIVVVGAGAAGLMAAIAAARQGPSKIKILLLDSRQKIGAKILMSGGSRCNVTHVRVTPQDYEGGPRHAVKHVLEAFTPTQTIEFFEAIGVPLVLEPTGKYFPATHSGKTVLEALLAEVERLGVMLKTGISVAEIKKTGDVFCLKGSDNHFEIAAKRVVLATGGLSYPQTGSDGAGLDIAKTLGHSIVRTTPALTPLTSTDEDWRSLSGVALDARLSFFESGKKRADRAGALLFTHFGFSGPVALDISRFVSGADPKNQFEIQASFLPSETEESLKKTWMRAIVRYPARLVRNFLTDEFSLPARFVSTFLRKTALDGSVTLKRYSTVSRGCLIHALLNCPLAVTGVMGYQKSEVTSGGVNLKEVKAATMESKIVSGLYFGGEILDVDGRIGGFNFQWAWSSGTLAGRSAAESIRRA